MPSLAQRLRRLARTGLLLREVRGVRKELSRIAAALETYNQHQWPQHIQPDPDLPAVEVSYVDAEHQLELMDIETRLTAARGQPPTEEEILQEYLRRHTDADGAWPVQH